MPETKETPKRIHDPFPLPFDENMKLEEYLELAKKSPARFLPFKPGWIYDGVLGFDVLWEETEYCGKWLNHYVTLYISRDEPKRVVGCRVEGIRQREGDKSDLYIEHEDAGHPGWTPEEVEKAKQDHEKAQNEQGCDI
jgi:hypothetical protein